MRPLPRLQGIFPKSLIGRVYTLFAFTLVFLILGGMLLFVKYTLTRELEDTQYMAETLAGVMSRTITDSAVIGDFDTIKSTLERAVQNTNLGAARFIDISGTSLAATNPKSGATSSPAWLYHLLEKQLYDVNLPIRVGGRDYGVLRLSFDIELVGAGPRPRRTTPRASAPPSPATSRSASSC